MSGQSRLRIASRASSDVASPNRDAILEGLTHGSFREA
jgi:hypothetical protein